jgi:anti-sigma factor RsiW
VWPCKFFADGLSNPLKGPTVKQHAEIQSEALAWVEGKLDAGRRSVIAHHLEECPDCRRYFETLSVSLVPTGTRPVMILAADPYLPVRVRAIAAERAAQAEFRDGAALRWTWRTAAFVLAMLLGIFIGESLSYRSPQVTDHHIVYEYSSSLWDSGIESRWQTISQVAVEEKR